MPSPYELEVTCGEGLPKSVKTVIVVSHERSGTHFLMNTLADNFGYVSFPWIDMDYIHPINWWASENILTFLNILKVEGKTVLNIVKSHHAVEFFLPVLDKILEDFFVFYIHRHREDALESFCKHINATPWIAGPMAKDGIELAAMEPCGALLRYQMKQHSCMYERILAHQVGWLQGVPIRLMDKIIYVEFESLRDRFNETVAWIAKKIGRGVLKEIRKPDKGDRVVTPEGKWIE